MDSIRENEKLEDMISTLQMELSNDYEGKLSIILVEGVDDVGFVKRVFEQSVVCYESFSGKEGLHQLIESEDIQDNRIIGIRDKDYALECELPSRLFCYDTCCMEIMLLSNKEVVKGLYTTYYKGNTSQDALVKNAMRQLAPLSVLREKNEKQSLNIDFKRAALSECIVGESESIIYEKLFSNLVQDEEMLEQCLGAAEQLQEDDLTEKTNGHDICRFLGKVFKSRKGDMGEERLREVLICSYRTEDFKNTYLYQKIKNYQQQYQLCYVR